MSLEATDPYEAAPRTGVTLFNPQTESWEDVRNAILKLEEVCFGERGQPTIPEDDLKSIFEDPDSIVVLLKKGNEVVGFTSAVPNPKVEGAVNIDATEMFPEDQGKENVIGLMTILESEARKRGYSFLTRDAAIENGYADKIQKNYADRIVETRDHDSVWGRQRYFKITL